MKHDEFLRRIDLAKAVKARKLGVAELSDTEVSLAAGLSSDYIRNQRRDSTNQPLVPYLVKLAVWLEQPPACFIDKSVPLILLECLEIDPRRQALARQVAEEELRKRPRKRREQLLEPVTRELYDVLTDFEKDGAQADHDTALRLLRAVVPNFVVSRMKRGK